MMNTSSDGPSISICCEPTKFYPPESSCYRAVSFPGEEMILPEIYHSNLSISSMSPKEFVPRYGMPCSENTSYYLESSPPKNDLFYLLEDGTIYVNKSIENGLDFFFRLRLEEYCFTSHVTENGTKSVVSICESFFDSYSSLNTITVVYYVITGLPLPFFAAIFFVYTILPELKNIHGLILRAYVACVFVVDCVAMIPLIYNPFGCEYLTAIILQFSDLGSFFWLNVMCFDIWWTFRSLQDKSKQRNQKKFVIYSIYAWGSSALITGVGMIIDAIPVLPKGIIKPGFHDACWFTDPTASLIYEDIPFVITLICNTCFFVLTAMKMIQMKKYMARHLEGIDSRRHNDEKQRFNVCLKLFIVMGMTKLANIVFWMCRDSLPIYVDEIEIFLNTLQRLSIFVIFVWKDKIKRLLLKRLGCKDRASRSRNSMDRTSRRSASNNYTMATSML